MQRFAGVDATKLFRIVARHRSYFIYTLVALIILWPLLQLGYILTLDMVFTPHIRLPEQVTSSYLFYAVLHYLNVLVPADVVEKVVLFLILFLSGLGMHRLMQYALHQPVASSKKQVVRVAQPGFPDYILHAACYCAGALYAVNPFTYDRFMAGQYAVLLGYALLPWFVRSLLVFLAWPTLGQTIRLATWAVAISIVSIHSIGLMVIVTIIAAGLKAWRTSMSPHPSPPNQVEGRLWIPAFAGMTRGKPMRPLTPVVKYGLLGLAIFVVASSYWLVPLVLGYGNTASVINGFGSGDQRAFATVGDGTIGRLGNVLRLQGFWAEGQNLYLLPQDVTLAWGVIALGVWALVIVGMTASWRVCGRHVTALFALIVVIAAVLAIGTMNGWLAAHVPLFAGYREPQKFVALVALGYAFFAGHGTAAILRRSLKRSVLAKRNEKSGNFIQNLLAFRKDGPFGTMILVFALACVVFNFTKPMWWGFDGQLVPRHYPADWFAVNERLDADQSNFKVLFLPWHLYMHFRFAGRIIANPASKFFDKPVIVSQNPELYGASPTALRPEQRQLNKLLPAASRNSDLGAQVAPLRVKYIVLAKDLDYQKYSYLNYQKDLQLVSESSTLKLYRNVMFKGE